MEGEIASFPLSRTPYPLSPSKKHFLGHMLIPVQLRLVRMYPKLEVGYSPQNMPANAEDLRDADSIPESGRPPGGGHGNPLQYSFLESPMDRGAWWATVHGVAKSRT